MPDIVEDEQPGAEEPGIEYAPDSLIEAAVDIVKSRTSHELDDDLVKASVSFLTAEFKMWTSRAAETAPKDEA